MTPWYHQPMSFQKLVSMANNNSAVIQDQTTQHPEPKKHKLLTAVLDLSDAQRQLLSDLLSGKAELIDIEGEKYAVQRTSFGYAVTNMDGHTRNVSCDMASCSCEDFKFRNHECKHIRGLRCYSQGS